MDPATLLTEYLPTHWPTQWKGSYQTKDHGPDQEMSQVTQATHEVREGHPHLIFEFTAQGSTHRIAALVTDLQGDAQITLDNTLQASHPVFNVGLAFHFPPATTAIVHFIFNDAAGQRQNYRFEGKVT